MAILRYLILAAALLLSLYSLTNIFAAASETPGPTYEKACLVSYSLTAILWTVFYALTEV